MAQVFNQNRVEIDDKLWSRFASEAKRSRRDPVRLLADLLRAYIDQKERERLNRDTIRLASKSGLTQKDDIEEIIRNLRKERFAKT
jgi:hypothetical protein